MERTERYIRITDTGPRPTLYAPAAYAVLRVERGAVYKLTMTDGELKSLVDAKLAEIAPPGSFDVFHVLLSGDYKANPNNGYRWEKQNA
jgi:hypothetical protein